MNHKVKKIVYDHVHCIAGCNVCHWGDGLNSEKGVFEKDVHNNAKKHAKQTGHNTWVEQGINTHYEVEEKLSNSECPKCRINLDRDRFCPKCREYR